jgi:hypothetical protein
MPGAHGPMGYAPLPGTPPQQQRQVPRANMMDMAVDAQLPAPLLPNKVEETIGHSAVDSYQSTSAAVAPQQQLRPSGTPMQASPPKQATIPTVSSPPNMVKRIL